MCVFNDDINTKGDLLAKIEIRSLDIYRTLCPNLNIKMLSINKAPFSCPNFIPANAPKSEYSNSVSKHRQI